MAGRRQPSGRLSAQSLPDTFSSVRAEDSGDHAVAGVDRRSRCDRWRHLRSSASAARWGRRSRGIASAPRRASASSASPRFSGPGCCASARSVHGIETIAADLLDRAASRSAAAHRRTSIFMAGPQVRRRAATRALTWAMNVHGAGASSPSVRGRAASSPSRPAASIRSSPVDIGGATEDAPDPAAPATTPMSCVGARADVRAISRARAARPGRIVPAQLRDRHALRRAARHRRARCATASRSIVTMGHVNVIWQERRQRQNPARLRHCTAPTSPLNVSGPGDPSVRAVAEASSQGASTSSRNSPGEEAAVAGWRTPAAARPSADPGSAAQRMIDWVKDWVERDLPTLEQADAVRGAASALHRQSAGGGRPALTMEQR